MLIKALLTAYLDVYEHKLTLRNLSPTTVMLDQTLSNVIFSDISEFCSWDESVPPNSVLPMPYSAMQLPAHRKSPHFSSLFDRWSVGIIMLEVLLGTGAVIKIRSI